MIETLDLPALLCGPAFSAIAVSRIIVEGDKTAKIYIMNVDNLSEGRNIAI